MQRTFVVGLLITISACLLLPERVSAQGIRGQVDWMFLSRDNKANYSPLITGPDSFSGSGVGFDYQSGYRVMLGYSAPQFEVEGQFTNLDEWHDSTYRTLTEELVFDDNQANPFIVGGTPGNVFGVTTALSAAAMDALTATLDDETLEGEFLTPGAIATFEYQSEYSDGELNITTSRCNWWRVGLGYRHVELDELAGFGVIGQFDALDVDDGQTVGGVSNDENDGLSNAALVEAGLVNSVSADGFDNILSAAGPDTLAIGIRSKTTNRLNGIQGTFDGSIVDSPYFLLDLAFRMGLFHNQTSATVTESVVGSENDSSVYSRSLEDNDNTYSFLVGTGFRAAIKLTDNLRIHTGYEFVFINNVALAPSQAAQVAPGGIFSIDNGSNVVIHGARLGLELVF
ncbi:MAG: hypothetical protein R3C02_15990 [Planctomycetaceae bacterium]